MHNLESSRVGELEILYSHYRSEFRGIPGVRWFYVSLHVRSYSTTVHPRDPHNAEHLMLNGNACNTDRQEHIRRLHNAGYNGTKSLKNWSALKHCLSRLEWNGCALFSVVCRPRWTRGVGVPEPCTSSECWSGFETVIETVFGNNDDINIDVTGIQIKVRNFHVLQSERTLR